MDKLPIAIRADLAQSHTLKRFAAEIRGLAGMRWQDRLVCMPYRSINCNHHLFCTQQATYNNATIPAACRKHALGARPGDQRSSCVPWPASYMYASSMQNRWLLQSSASRLRMAHVCVMQFKAPAANDSAKGRECARTSAHLYPSLPRASPSSSVLHFASTFGAMQGRAEHNWEYSSKPCILARDYSCKPCIQASCIGQNGQNPSSRWVVLQVHVSASMHPRFSEPRQTTLPAVCHCDPCCGLCALAIGRNLAHIPVQLHSEEPCTASAASHLAFSSDITMNEIAFTEPSKALGPTVTRHPSWFSCPVRGRGLL